VITTYTGEPSAHFVMMLPCIQAPSIFAISDLVLQLWLCLSFQFPSGFLQFHDHWTDKPQPLSLYKICGKLDMLVRWWAVASAYLVCKAQSITDAVKYSEVIQSCQSESACWSDTWQWLLGSVCKIGFETNLFLLCLVSFADCTH
jgi:hypothetical protein